MNAHNHFTCNISHVPQPLGHEVNIPYANSSLFTYDEAKIFHASLHTAVSYFFASFIASITSYVIFLTSFCQAGSESSAIK